MRKRNLNFRWLGHTNWQGIGAIAAIVSLLWSFFIFIVPNLPPIMVGPHQTSPPSPGGVTTTPIPSPVTMPTPSPTPAIATDWGTLIGDSITVNKTLSCGDGCPDPVIVKITTMQISKPNEMTWNLSLSAPSGTPNNGFTEASFPQFTLSSDVTPAYQVNPESITVSDFQVKFPFVPVSNHIYTLAVTVSYHRLTGGIVSIAPESVAFNPVIMLFQP